MSAHSSYSPKDLIQSSLDSHRREVDDFTSGLTELVTVLPERMRHWAIGEEEIVHATVLETWSGDPATDASWLELFSDGMSDYGVPPELCAMFPNASDFTRSAPGLGSLLTRVDNPCRRVRALIQEPLPMDSATRLRDYFGAGGDARVHSSLPLFLCVDSAANVAIGGDASGADGLVLLRSPVMAGIARELFSRLWTTGRSLPHRKHLHEWSPLLRLLFQGETLESASRRLRYNPRTARRRLEAAYAHYGVGTLFSLGVAWGANVVETGPHAGQDQSREDEGTRR
ncbi:MAG: hypothetical protein IR160_01325 [Salinibacterium sp.]|nr:hypothetical protein [Salinibacterium sp.]MBF0671208.1 hypothetical protein [Salinibacterium sp.]